MATMLAFVGLLFLAIMGIVGLTEGFRFGFLNRKSTAILAGAVIRELASLFLHHDPVAVLTQIRLEIQSTNTILKSVDFR